MMNEKIENGAMKLNEEELENVAGGVVILDGIHVDVKNTPTKSFPPAEGEHYNIGDLVKINGGGVLLHSNTECTEGTKYILQIYNLVL